MTECQKKKVTVGNATKASSTQQVYGTIGTKRALLRKAAQPPSQRLLGH